MLRIAVLTALSLALCAPAPAQTAPTVDDLVSKNIAARGGLEKIKAIQSLKIAGKAVAMNGLELPLTIYVKRPACMRMEMTFQGKHIVQAFDGTEAWSINPMTGSDEARKSSEQETRSARDNAAELMDGNLLDYKSKGVTIEPMGKEEVEGAPAYKLKIRKKDGTVSYDWLDAGSFLDAKYSDKTAQAGQDTQVETYPTNYKPEGGVMLAHAVDQRVHGQSMMKMLLDSVQVNPSLDDALFKFPAPTTEAKPAEKK